MWIWFEYLGFVRKKIKKNRKVIGKQLILIYVRSWKKRVIWRDVPHLFLMFHGKFFLPIPQRIGFHGKTEKDNRTSHQITRLFFQLLIKNSILLNYFPTFYQTPLKLQIGSHVPCSSYCLKIKQHNGSLFLSSHKRQEHAKINL